MKRNQRLSIPCRKCFLLVGIKKNLLLGINGRRDNLSAAKMQNTLSIKLYRKKHCGQQTIRVNEIFSNNQGVFFSFIC